MGESKRRRKAVEAFQAEIVEARYRPGRVLVLREPEDDPDAFRLLVAGHCLVPNAVRPAAFADLAAIPVEGGIDPFAETIDEPVCLDLTAGVIRPFRDEEFEAVAESWHPGILVIFTGEPVLLRASVDGGILAADGAPLPDPLAAMGGLLRLGASGEPLVPADAPMFLQYACLRAEALAAAGSAAVATDVPVETAAHHLRHLEALHRHSVARADPGREGWLDHDALDAVISDAVFPADLDADPVEEVLDGIDLALDTAAAFPADRVACRIGPRLGIAPVDWMCRADPGAGVVFEDADARMSTALGAPASNRSEVALVRIGESAGRDARVRAYLDGLPNLGARSPLTLHRDGDLVIGSFRENGFLHLVVSPPEDEGPRLSDPLMTEGLLDVDLDVLGDFQPSPEDLAELSLIEHLPDPPTIEDYPLLALARAGAEGATFADFCAAFAELMRWPAEDPKALSDLRERLAEEDEEEVDPASPGGDARFARRVRDNGELADRLAGLGGSPAPRLLALLRPVFSALSFSDADRDARLLLDAARRGASLGELAVHCRDLA